MKVFNNPHFSKQLTPSQSLVGSRTKTLLGSRSMAKSQTIQDIMILDGGIFISQQNIDSHQNENIDQGNVSSSGFQEVTVRSPPINDDFIEKLQRLSEKQKKDNDEKSSQQPELLNSAAQFNLVEQMTELHDNVLDHLLDYRTKLANKNMPKEEAAKFRQQIKQDCAKIQQEYADIIMRFNANVIVNQQSVEKLIPSQEEENEINQLFNLVEEFLEKFNGQRALMNAYTILLKEKVEQSGIGSDLVTENENERSSMYDFEFNPYDSSTDASDINEQISNLRQELVEKSSAKDLERSSVILDCLEEIQSYQDLESRIHILAEQKAIVETDLRSSVEKALSLLTAKKEEIDQTLTQSQNQKRIKGIRRRKFFDIALKIKKSLPNNHQGRQMLVNELYEESIEEGVLEQDFESWIKSQYESAVQ